MRYLVFAGDYYYPCGGWEDYRGYANSLDDIPDILRQNSDNSWFQIVDTLKHACIIDLDTDIESSYQRCSVSELITRYEAARKAYESTLNVENPK